MDRPRARARTLAHMEQLIAGVSVSLVACGGSYGVVDPMPPPAVCPHAGRTISASASFEKDASGKLVLAVRVDAPGNPEVTYIDDEPFVMGAKVLSKGRIGSAMELRLDVDPQKGTAPVTLEIPIHCTAGKDGIAVTVSWATMAEGAPVSAAVEPGR